MNFKFAKKFRYRAACIALTAVMGATCVAGTVTALSGGSTVSADSKVYSLEFGDAKGKVDLTQIKIDNFSKQVVENAGASVSVENLTRTVIVRLKGKSLAEAGDSRSAAARIEKEQKSFLSALDKKGISYKLRSTYDTIINAVAIDVKLSQLKTIKAIGGVSTVSVGSTYSVPKDAEGGAGGAQTNYSNIYENGIYNSSEYVEDGIDGSGMTVAILDTGLDYTHEAFKPNVDNDKISFTKDYVQDKIDGNGTAYKGSSTLKAVQRSGVTLDDVYINEKVPFAYDYADSDANVYPSYSQHGTHVAGIVAGAAESYTDKHGETAKDKDGNTLKFRGVAPKAQLVICKVFTDNLEDDAIGGAEAVDIIDALEDCYKLNVDVVNMSLGTSGGFSSKALGLSDEDEEGRLMGDIYETLRSSGITMMVAASNEFSAGYGSVFGTNLTSNPDSGTIGSPSTFTGSMSVASINGQRAPYIVANQGTADAAAFYFEESRDEFSEANDFIGELLGDQQTGTFKYVVVQGTGEATDYTQSIRNKLKDKQPGEKVIAVVRRGNSPFKDKIQTAKENGADAVIVYNNVSGMIRMSLGDLVDPIPSISVSQEAGLRLTGSAATHNVKDGGTVTLNKDWTAGPFMNDYSSWGPSPDLQLKPDVTSHGGEITSAVAGGYDEMSGTSMACPNLAGFTALFKGWLKTEKQSLWNGDYIALTKLTNNIIMSTATTVYDPDGLPYSPRKQGAGLATLKNVFGTNAYLSTKDTDDTSDPERMCEDGRPKAELKDDPGKKGEYSITFYVNNFGESPLTFKTKSIFMTESVGMDGKSVAEKAHLFGNDATWKVDGAAVAEGGEVTVAGGKSSKIEVTLKLTTQEMRYLDENFTNGMFVEGFLQLVSQNSAQCDLTLPFMGFYGDWKDAPMMDFSCFEIAEDAKDSSLKEEERKQPSVWATQAYGYYAGEKYSVPLGSFTYLQDEEKEHTSEYIYPEEEHVAISRDFHENYGANNSENYFTTGGIRALYAGLLRNAEVVTYTISNEDTGEIISENKEVYRAGKAYAGGGSSSPSLVNLELKTEDMGLAANGKYRMDFRFYFDYDDYKNGTFTNADGETYGVYKDNVFSMTFYVDYEAPILVDSRIRFVDRKADGSNKDIQDVYLDLDIFDNHYPQAVILCYSDKADDVENSDLQSIKLATEYIVPVINPRKNSTNTVSIDITDIYDDYKGRLFVEIDDYALNNSVYYINPDYTKTNVCPADFKVTKDGAELAENTEIVIPKNTTVKLGVDNAGDANVSNFNWNISNPYYAISKNSEIFGVNVGRTLLTVYGKDSKVSRTFTVVVTDSAIELPLPDTVSFGTMINSDDYPVKAADIVRVNPAQQFTLSIQSDPWYYPVNKLHFVWSSSDEKLATVDKNGRVTVKYEGERTRNVTITAQAEENRSITATVTLRIRDPYDITNNTLTRYRGWGSESDADGNRVVNAEGKNILYIPADRGITTIGEEAFRDNENVQVIVIPKSVTTIAERAFLNCKTLEKICFISEDKIEPADSSLNMIQRGAFSGCDKLTTVDLSNCKVITLDSSVFTGCPSLKNIVKWGAIGTAGTGTFAGCTALETADLSGLYMVGSGVFAGCTSLKDITIGNNTALGSAMFSGCTSLESVTVNCASVPAYAFSGCTSLKEVTFTAKNTVIGMGAFENCALETATVDANASLSTIGHYAFRGCRRLETFENLGTPEIGYGAFDGVTSMNGRLIAEDGTLYYAPLTVTAATLSGVTAIAPNALSGRTLDGLTELDLSNIQSIGNGAFRGLKGLTSVILPQNLTEIPANAFNGCTDLTQITIPAGVTKIGDGAFYGCTSLATVTYDGTAVKEIGVSAFENTAITELDLPASVKVLGDEAFARNTKLTRVNLPSVEDMGTAVFAFCPLLDTAVFGEDSTTTGTYTFTTRRFDEKGNEIERTASALTNVTLCDNIKEIGAGAFAYAPIVTIDLKKADSIGDQAFFGCVELTTVTGIEKVKTFGSEAFAYSGKLSTLNLAAAETIGDSAFVSGYDYGDKITSVTFGDNLKTIGRSAFEYSGLTEVTIPASVTQIGVSAFGVSASLAQFKVDEGNGVYFADGGVLYRYIDKDAKIYELCAYPAGRTADREENLRAYTVIDGTVAIGEQAFYGVRGIRLQKVTLPYTLKLIGDAAFLASELTHYQFEGINAPVLLEGITERKITKGNYSANSFFYQNFNGYLADCAARYPGDTNENATNKSTLTILYPSNGTGYTNFVYSNYFGTATLLSERMEDDTRRLIEIIDGLPAASEVGTWNSSNKTKPEIQNYSDLIKEAHGLYLALKTEVQRAFVGEERIEKFFAVEQAFIPVKNAFGIPRDISNISVAPESTHKSQYVVDEKFSLDGLKLLVTYDDYTTEVIDASEYFTIVERFDRPLRITDVTVNIIGSGKYAGFPVSIAITVTEGGAPVGGLPAYAIALIVVGGVLVLAAAAAVTLFILNKKGVITLKFLKRTKKDESVSGGESDTSAAESVNAADGEEVSENVNKDAEQSEGVSNDEKGGEEETDD
ncbi:MAG: leucine-rich repeat protein [Clostridia bacterium]|nr:leucine-rich repeat protein [Clostridia bacterium]